MSLGLVLVTPKAVKLRPGCLVEVRRSAWEVLVPHELDEFKTSMRLESGLICNERTGTI